MYSNYRSERSRSYIQLTEFENVLTEVEELGYSLKLI